MNEFVNKIYDLSAISQGGYCLGMEMETIGVDGDYESQQLTDYVTTLEDEPANNNVMKVIAAAMQIALEKGILKSPVASIFQTATTAVSIVKTLKYSHSLEEAFEEGVERGAEKLEEITEKHIDDVAARASVAAEIILQPEVLEQGMDIVLDAVGMAFPPIQPATQFVKQFTPVIAEFVSNKVKPVVQRGIKKAVPAVKKFTHNVIIKAKTKVVDAGKNLFTKVASLFSK